MSIESMTTGSTVVRQTQSHTIGASGGDVTVFIDGDSLDCRCQESSSSESEAFDARGEKSGFRFYFAADPGFTVDDRIKLTKWDEVAVSPAKLMRVTGAKRQGRPSGGLGLWIVTAEEETQRFEV